MDKKPTWWQIMKIKIGLGKPFASVTNLGEVDSSVVKFRNYYISVMEQEGKIVNLSWSKDPHMFPDVNMNDFYDSSRTGSDDDE